MLVRIRGLSPLSGFAILAGAALFLATSGLLKHGGNRSPEAWSPELSVVLPYYVAGIMAAGDRYLAANLQVIRGQVVAHRLGDNKQKGLFTRLLRNASRLNPAQEDGYYLAQAVLPWNGYVGINQETQARAAKARSWDWLPLFFRAFNRYYFLREPGPASAILRQAADRAAPENRESLLANAARWRAVGKNPEEALRVLRAMIQGTPQGPLRQNLRARRIQLEGLLKLREAAEAYRRETGEAPTDLEKLLGYGGLQEIPEDPLGEGYILKETGKVVITPPKPLREDFQLSEAIK